MLRRIFDALGFFSIGFISGMIFLKVIEPKEEIILDIPNDSIQHTVDSLYNINDSIKTKIIYLEKEYETKVNYIISSSDSVQLSLFTGYVDSFYRAYKDSQYNICGALQNVSADSSVRTTDIQP